MSLDLSMVGKKQQFYSDSMSLTDMFFTRLKTASCTPERAFLPLTLAIFVPVQGLMPSSNLHTQNTTADHQQSPTLHMSARSWIYLSLSPEDWRPLEQFQLPQSKLKLRFPWKSTQFLQTDLGSCCWEIINLDWEMKSLRTTKATKS